MSTSPEEQPAKKNDPRYEPLPRADKPKPAKDPNARQTFNGWLLLLMNILLALAVSTTLQLTINGVVEKEWRLLEPYSTLTFGFNVAVFTAIFSLIQAASNRWLFSALFCVSGVAFLGVVDIYKLMILNRPLLIRDFLLIKQLVTLMPSLTTALGGVLAGIGIGLITMLGVMWWSWRKQWLSAGPRYRVSVGALSVGFLIVLLFISAKTNTEYDPNALITNITWNQKENYERNGFLLAFTMNASQILHGVSKPSGYSEAAVASILDRYQNEERRHGKAAGCRGGEQPVNVILILAEAFWDPTRLPVKFNEDPIPFFRSLQKQWPSGNLTVPTFGGYTAKTEFEILTGLSLSFMPEISNPYTTYLSKSQAALPAVFRANGYRVLAVHPYQKSMWGRAHYFPFLGFEEFQDIESFKSPEYKGPFISDNMLASRIIEESKERAPYFMFAISMGSHAPYDYDYEPFTKGRLDVLSPMSENSRRMLRTYINAINQTDQALRRLVEHFSKVDQKTLIVFFGDHLPMLGTNNEVYREAGYLKRDGDFEKIMFDPPAVVWANYELPREDISRRSHFLYPYLIEKAGVRAPLAARVIAAQQRLNPQLQDKALSDQYWMLQYDLLFGKQHALKNEQIKYTDSSLFVKQIKELYSEAQQAPKTPEIVRFGPRVSAGLRKFDRLSNGDCAMWFQTHHAMEDAVVYLDGQPLATTAPNSELVSAVLPPRMIRKPGQYKLYLYNPKSKLRSNEVTLKILDETSATLSADLPSTKPLNLQITSWGPQHTRPGKPFNVQKDGTSALWFKVKNATPTMVVTFDGQPLPTDQATSGSLSALLKPDALKKAGLHEILIVDRVTSQSAPKVIFTVGEPPRPEPAAKMKEIKPAAPPPAPLIVNWGPQQTGPGKPFNVQKDGSSALWFKVKHATPTMVVTFDGKPLATDQAASGSLSALLKPAALKKAGRHEIQVVDRTSGQRSTKVVFTVGQAPKAEMTPAPTPKPAPRPPAPQLASWGPQQTLIGTPFNVQKDGSSAFWFKVKNAAPKMVVIFDGKPLATDHAASGSLSALLKPEALKKAGRHEIQVVDQATGQGTDKVIFSVVEAPKAEPANAAKAAPASAQPTPQIVSWGPRQTRAGEPFSRQPDGSSSIWFQVSDGTPATVVVFEGKPLKTFYRDASFLSANVPMEFLKKKGHYRLWLQNGPSTPKSREVVFEVTETQPANTPR